MPLFGKSNTDSFAQPASVWEDRILVRKAVLDEARASGDENFVARAQERLDNALDAYNRDRKCPGQN